MLEILASVEPRFVLSGGAALAGVYLGHRTTRDLDLFWRNLAALETVRRHVMQVLSNAGLTTDVLQTTPAFSQLHVTDGTSTVVVDLIAEAADNLAPPESHRIGRTEILVDPPQAILAEKLCALLERVELRDLIDIEALIRNGQDLDRALADAPRRDRGFSPITLAWLLRDFDVKRLAPTAGLDASGGARLDAFREALIEKLLKPA